MSKAKPKWIKEGLTVEQLAEIIGPVKDILDLLPPIMGLSEAQARAITSWVEVRTQLYQAIGNDAWRNSRWAIEGKRNSEEEEGYRSQYQGEYVPPKR